ncbi:MAG: trypsin-like peptidase domain-containing protein [Patescibacteria group bacterium]|nr:trypsin-like peptidase domain-containing protein [Patescibacteria group bacterium]
MQKLEYEDLEEGDIRKRKNQFKKGRWALFIAIIIIAFIVGVVGGIGGILMLSANQGSIAKKLGINFSELSIPTIRTEKLVLEESNAVVDASAKVSSAVVSIQAKSTTQDQFGQVYQTGGAGTGFIITNDGLVITNKHVVTDANAQYTVITDDGKTYDGVVKSVDPFQDIAVIKIDAKNLPVVELGDSDQLKVGQWVVAVGNALGKFENTVTVGVISARNRKIEATDNNGNNAESLDDIIQTDAAINPGNSGGPLVNMKGQVVGINTAVAADAQGIGFAIPINQAKSAIESIKKTGRIVRPYLGVRYLPITKELAAANKYPVDYGALVVKGSGIGQVAVVPGSPADKAGIQENDIILEVNGEKIDQNNGLIKLIQQYEVGKTVELKVLSKGQEKTVKVALEEGK